jgi:predicted NBD/HSP70 family sugar kinase
MNNIVVISIHKGIGAGIIINHQIYRGEQGEAGEIGRAVYPTVFADPGKVEKIENYASQDAIIDLLKKQKGLTHLDFDEVAELYAQDDAIVVKAIDDFRDYITMIVYNAAVSYNPDTIYLSSNLIETIDQLLPMIVDKYNRLPENGNTDIRMLKGAKYASLLGGCSAVTHLALKMSNQRLKFNFDLSNAFDD